MPKKVSPDALRVPLNCLVAPETRSAINRLRGEKSQGEFIDGLVVGSGMNLIIDAPRKQTKKERLLAELAALDPVGAAREDVELGNFELPRGGSVSQPRTSLDAVAPLAGSQTGKASMETWRAGRKPLMKPKERKR